MLEILSEMEELGATPEQMCTAGGTWLGLDKPVPWHVIRRAREDARFADHLQRSRNQRALLDLLIEHPRTAGYAESSDPALPSNLELASRFAKSLAKWAANGLQTADAATSEQRFARCLACPHLAQPPASIVYKIKLSGKSDMRVCDQCGCVAARKVRIPGESCPRGQWLPVKPSTSANETRIPSSRKEHKS